MSDTSHLIITWNVPTPAAREGQEAITLEALREEVVRGRWWRRIGRYRQVELHAYRAACVPRPFAVALVIRLLSRGSCAIVAPDGTRVAVGVGEVLRRGWRMACDALGRGRLLHEAERELHQLDQPQQVTANLAAHPLYLRTDLAYGVISGGSVGHIAGVLNHLDRFAAAPVFVSTDRIPTVREDIEAHIAPAPDRFMDFAELPELAHNRGLIDTAMTATQGRRIGFLYQRYSRFNFVGLALSRGLGVPLVLEYNGSEVWIARHWGRPLKYQTIAEQIELTNLRRADVVVVVSQPIKDELIEHGIKADKVLVNANGVDAERYSPAVDGSAVRGARGLGGKLVIGFIGTFGAWHGAEVLAEAFGRLLEKRPDLREHARLLMIGDGVKMPQVREALARHGAAGAAVLTGLVPQAEGPAHLAACDVLASPHVPNPDGTPFFGSPTKLFEYMAMGRGIVASDLDQIGQVLEHDRTAWLVRPGDADDLARGIEILIDNPALRQRLGAAARQCALERHTWKEHTRNIIDKLTQLCEPVVSL